MNEMNTHELCIEKPKAKIDYIIIWQILPCQIFNMFAQD